MPTILSLLLSVVRSSLQDLASLQLKLVALRHQIAVLERNRTTRPLLTRIDRLFWVCLYSLWPACLDIVVIVKPDTVIGWHRLGFLCSGHGNPLARWATAGATGREGVDPAMNRENPLWGAPRIHGELLKLGIEISQATVSN